MSNNYRLGHREVEARRHDGTDECAYALADWVRENSGVIEVVKKGQFDYDLDNAYLHLHDRYDRFVQPNFWIVKTEDDQFYSVYPDIFKKQYVSISAQEPISDE